MYSFTFTTVRLLVVLMQFEFLFLQFPGECAGPAQSAHVYSPGNKKGQSTAFVLLSVCKLFFLARNHQRPDAHPFESTHLPAAPVSGFAEILSNGFYQWRHCVQC